MSEASTKGEQRRRSRRQHRRGSCCRHAVVGAITQDLRCDAAMGCGWDLPSPWVARLVSGEGMAAPACHAPAGQWLSHHGVVISTPTTPGAKLGRQAGERRAP
eukprot:7629594-Alexandrium_andersonii.AAC.1